MTRPSAAATAAERVPAARAPYAELGNPDWDDDAYCAGCGTALGFEEMEFNGGLCTTCLIDARSDPPEEDDTDVCT